MKIAFIVPGFSADETDWCIPAHTDIVKTLALTHEVHVYTMRYPHRIDNYRIGNAFVHSFNGVGSRGLATLRLWQTVSAAIAHEHRKSPFHLVHSIFGSESGAVALLAGKQLHIPSAVWLVNGELIGLPSIGYGADLSVRQRLMNNLILRFADRILCGCDTLTRTALACHPRARAKTFPLGVNLKRFAPSPSAAPNPERAHFINVGSLTPIKDQKTLLRAFALVSAHLPNALLTIAGEGPLDTDLRALAKSLNLSDRVTFAGSVPHDQLPALYKSAGVFVQSSLHEGQGMALLEAAACGCAVCGTDVGVLADLARRDAGVVAVSHDPAALADAMTQAYPRRNAISAHGRETIECEYNLDLIASGLENLYVDLIRGDNNTVERNVAGA